MNDENWKPSFKEMATSQSWTENILMYFVSFGAVLYMLVSPHNWIEWAFVSLLSAVLAGLYWVIMINFNRSYIKEKNRQLLRDKEQLKLLNEQLSENKNQNN